MDYIDGRAVPARRVTSVERIAGSHHGTMLVETGGALTVDGEIHGTVNVGEGGTLRVDGAVHGTLHVESGAVAQIVGSQHGTVSVDQGGLMEVAATGSVMGATTINGTLRNAGTRGGATNGTGHIEDLPGATLRRPSRIEGNIHFYE